MELELIQDFIALKPRYQALNITNLWASQLMAFSARYSKNATIAATIKAALQPDKVAKPVTERKATKFITSNVQPAKAEECEGCQQARAKTILGSDPKTLRAPKKDATPEAASVPKTVADVLVLYPTLEDLQRASTMLNIKYHPQAKEQKLASAILVALQDID